MHVEPTQGGLKGMWQAFIPGGYDASDGEEYHNVAGNTLGSWVFRINYDADSWKLGFYGDHSSRTIVLCSSSIMMDTVRVINGILIPSAVIIDIS